MSRAIPELSLVSEAILGFASHFLPFLSLVMTLEVKWRCSLLYLSVVTKNVLDMAVIVLGELLHYLPVWPAENLKR